MATERRGAAVALVLGCLLFGVACASIEAPVVPPIGGAFTLYSAPLETHFEATPIGSKVGTARMSHFELPVYTTRIPISTWAEAGIRKAAANAGIQTVHYADYQLLSVLGIYLQLTVRASGD